ncbi:envelope stress response membrane protein PspC [Desulfosediminicola flagellatus]|uniref:envelope stress response membrane protein PspC n=1 Tax=Desulfosediminicola flagellatus TaxID=2569541 RepID=UPI0010AD3B67|nr:envelope stress response membrane protein PspC [Desulfosediminicola flagellatus]
MSNSIRKNGIYRSREGVLLGVCQGIADHYDLSIFWVRFGLVIVFMLSGFWPVIGIYIVAALLMKPRPVQPIQSDDEQEFYDSYVNSPRSAAQRLRRKYETLERRIRRMEDKVTGSDFEWERKFNS